MKKARNVNGFSDHAQAGLSGNNTIVGDDASLTLSHVASLKACAKSKDLLTGSRIHNVVVQRGLLGKSVSLGNTLISMYAKCGALDKAQEVFDELPIRNLVSWNALITGYAQNRNGEDAFTCFQQMQLGGFSPDEVTFVCMLKACGSIQALERGQEIHAQIVREKLLQKSIVVANGLVDMYVKCGLLEKAQEVFDELLVRDTVTWNTLIAGYAYHGHGEEALHYFDLMQLRGFTPNAITFICALKACGNIGALDTAQEIHAQVLKERLLEKHIMIANTLVDMYAKCGALERAQAVFDELRVRDIVSWNALLVGYSQHGHGEKAVNCFEQMQHGGQYPNAFTLACILKACGSIGALGKGQEVHAHIVRERLLDTDFVIGNALVDMYAKCGSLEKAQEVFDELPYQDIVSWTALIGGYVQHYHGEKAFSCFEKMQLGGVSPNAVTFACILKACSSIGVPDKGQEIHTQIVREHVLERDVMVGTALVDMYATCGMLAEAQELFDKLPMRDAVLWGVLIAGYAQLGEDKVVLNLFDKMIEERIEPNLFTFTIVLNTCCRKGLVHKAQEYFGPIRKSYGIIPTLEHHTCMVDLLGQVGDLDKAVEVIKEMPCASDLRLWLTLLSACRKWGNWKIGRWVFEQAACVEEKDAATYICMSNIYKEAGREEVAGKVEHIRVSKQAWNSMHFVLGIKGL